MVKSIRIRTQRSRRIESADAYVGILTDRSEVIRSVSIRSKLLSWPLDTEMEMVMTSVSGGMDGGRGGGRTALLYRATHKRV